MAKYIELEAAKMAVVEALGKGYNPFNAIVMLPAADVVPVVHGINKKKDFPGLFGCSVCGWCCDDTYYGDTSEYNYCPNCGALMDGKDGKKS